MLLCAALLALAACGADEQGTATSEERPLPWADFVAAIIDQYYRCNSGQAV